MDGRRGAGKPFDLGDRVFVQLVQRLFGLSQDGQGLVQLGLGLVRDLLDLGLLDVH